MPSAVPDQVRMGWEDSAWDSFVRVDDLASNGARRRGAGNVIGLLATFAVMDAIYGQLLPGCDRSGQVPASRVPSVAEKRGSGT